MVTRPCLGGEGFVMLFSVVQAGEPGMGRPTAEDTQELACIQGTIQTPTAQHSHF